MVDASRGFEASVKRARISSEEREDLL